MHEHEKRLTPQTVSIFIVVYTLMIALSLYIGLDFVTIAALSIFMWSVFLIITEVIIRSAAGLLGASLMLILFSIVGFEHYGFESAKEFVQESIELEIIFTLFGIIIIAILGLKSGLFYYIGIKIAKISRGDPIKLYVILAIFTYLLGYALNVDAGIVVVVSLTLAISDVLRIDPRPYIIMEIFIVNVSASATLISAIPNIIVAEKAHLSYGFFLVYLAPFTAIFFVVSLWFLYARVPPTGKVDPLRAITILEIDEWLFVRNKFEFYAAALSIVGMIFAFIAFKEFLIVAIFFASVSLAVSSNAEELLHDMDWDMLFFFMGFYVVVEGLKETGILKLIADWLISISGNDPLKLITAFFFISLVISSFLDNIPYIITIMPVVQIIVLQFPQYEYILWIALILACNIGGGLNPYSAPQNLIAISMSKRAGHHIPSSMYYRASIGWTFIGGFMAYAYLIVLMYEKEIIMLIGRFAFFGLIALIIGFTLLAAIKFTVGLRKSRRLISSFIRGFIKRLKREKEHIRY